MTVAAPAIELSEITKVFGALRANDGVSFRVEKGSIHGIVGENGAGKSTAMKILYGIYLPESGEIRVNGVARRWKTPKDAIRAGIGMVHQHFMLAGPHTVLDNIVVGAESLWGAKGWRKLIPAIVRPIDRKAARRRLDELAKQYGLPLDWDAPVESLPVGLQQRVEIMKLLYRGADIMILDEPTAVLTPQETLDLFVNLRKLRNEGKTILVITHKLKEVMSHTDRVTVFRAGRVTGEVKTSETSPQDLADRMVGRKVVLTVEAPGAAIRDVGAPPALELERLRLERSGERPRLNDVSLRVARGEVVGIAGVEGNGQSELIHAILHPREADQRTSGVVRILGRDVTHFTAGEIRSLRVGVVPEDRHHEGLLLGRSLTDNFLLGLQRDRRFENSGWIRGKELKRATVRALNQYDVRPRLPEALASGLSGGNQQKLIIAREFERQPELLIAAQPTRGVDVGAIEFIHKRILEARSQGAGVLLISSELDEILALSDRILVMYEGAVVGEFARGQCDEKELGLKMGGAHA